MVTEQVFGAEVLKEYLHDKENILQINKNFTDVKEEQMFGVYLCKNVKKIFDEWVRCKENGVEV